MVGLIIFMKHLKEKRTFFLGKYREKNTEEMKKIYKIAYYVAIMESLREGVDKQGKINENEYHALYQNASFNLLMLESQFT